MKEVWICVIIYIFRRVISVMVSKDGLLLVFPRVVDDVRVKWALTAI